jgi:hypothetical protein
VNVFAEIRAEELLTAKGAKTAAKGAKKTAEFAN